MSDKLKSDFFFYFAFAAFIFGTKLWLINKYGNATPFWDQWDAEAASLYVPFHNGTLSLGDLLAPHNEHRILSTRLLALAELVLNGIWNPLLQMVVNAVLHVITLVLAILLMTQVIGRKYLPALLVFSALLFALPFGWENTLAGFQAQFYFVLLFSILSLWFTTTHEPFSAKWFIGLLFSGLAFFSLASGVFCIAASAAVSFIFYIFGYRRTLGQLLASALLTVFFVIGVHFTPVIPAHQVLKAGSAGQFLKAFFHILWWPCPNKFLGLLQNAPVILFGLWMVKKKPAAKDNQWFLVAILIWMIGTVASVAYGRAVAPLSPRYLDLFTIAVLLSFVCLLLLIKECPQKMKKYAYVAATVWILSVGTCAEVYNSRPNFPSLQIKKDQSTAEEINARNYVVTGNISCLEDKPWLDIPYPVPEHLASILNNPQVRSILPSNIAPPDRPIKEGYFDGFVAWLLANYSIFIGIGILAAVIGVLLNLFGWAEKGEKVPM